MSPNQENINKYNSDAICLQKAFVMPRSDNLMGALLSSKSLTNKKQRNILILFRYFHRKAQI